MAAMNFSAATRCTKTRTGAEARRSGRFGLRYFTAARTQAGKLAGTLPFSVRTIAQNRDKRYKTQLCSDKYLACVKSLTGTDQVRFDRELDYNVKNWQIRRMLLDMDTYLPGTFSARWIALP